MLDTVQQWMVKRNLEYVQTEGIEAVVNRLRENGYNKVADAVLESILEAAKNRIKNRNQNGRYTRTTTL